MRYLFALAFVLLANPTAASERLCNAARNVVLDVGREASMQAVAVTMATIDVATLDPSAQIARILDDLGTETIERSRTQTDAMGRLADAIEAECD